MGVSGDFVRPPATTRGSGAGEPIRSAGGAEYMVWVQGNRCGSAKPQEGRGRTGLPGRSTGATPIRRGAGDESQT